MSSWVQFSPVASYNMYVYVYKYHVTLYREYIMSQKLEYVQHTYIYYG